jgi:tetratricopeptide (TPR) repeat protein
VDFAVADLAGRKHSLSGLKGRPAVLLFWSASVPPARTALSELAKQKAALAAAGAAPLALAVDPPEDHAKVRAASLGVGIPVAMAGEEIAGAFSVLNQYLFVRKENLRLPTAFLLNVKGEIVKAYRDPIVGAEIVADVARIEAPAAERLARALPFKGTFQTTPADRSYLQYAMELVEQGYDQAALPAFERAAKEDPTALALFSMGTLYMKKGEPVKARASFERALSLKADFAEASNSLGALLAQSGNVPGAIARFKLALEMKPDYADAMNNLGYALFQTGQKKQAYELYQKALALQPDFPEAFNNLGLYHAGDGDFAQAGGYFEKAFVARPNPSFEPAYLTLAKLYLDMGRRREGLQTLERLLQRNPTHPVALQAVRQIGAAR